jgi:hypothetical protein
MRSQWRRSLSATSGNSHPPAPRLFACAATKSRNPSSFSCGWTGMKRSDCFVFKRLPAFLSSLTQIATAPISSLWLTSETLRPVSSPRRSPPNNASSGSQNAASPCPPLRRSPFVNTAAAKIACSSRTSNGARLLSSSSNRMSANASAYSSGTRSSLRAQRPIDCRAPNSLLMVPAPIFCASGCSRPQAASSGKVAVSNLPVRKRLIGTSCSACRNCRA